MLFHFLCSCSSYCYNSQLSKDQVAYQSDPPRVYQHQSCQTSLICLAVPLFEADKVILPSHFQGAKDLDLSCNEISCTSFQATLIIIDKVWQPWSDSLFSKQQDSVFYAETSLMKNCWIFFFVIQVRKNCGFFSALRYSGLSVKTLLWDLLSFLQVGQAEKESVCGVGRQNDFSLFLSKLGFVPHKVDKFSEKSW